ncbi:MAG: hypothetical protein V1703_04420 [Candidatus Altiarchaeota archaeon]
MGHRDPDKDGLKRGSRRGQGARAGAESQEAARPDLSRPLNPRGPITRDEELRIVERNTAANPKGVWADPRLREVVGEIPEAHFARLNAAIEQCPDDVRVFLNVRRKFAGGGATKPRDFIAQVCSRGETDYSFSVHAIVPGFALAYDLEEGHDDMRKAMGIPKRMKTHFSDGAIYDRQVQVTTYAQVPDLSRGQIARGVYQELQALMPEGARLIEPSVEEHPRAEEVVISRGMTPGGQHIGTWHESSPSRQIERLSAMSQSLREKMRSQGDFLSDREMDEIFRDVEKARKEIERLGSSHETIVSGVVFEGGYAYTSFPLPVASQSVQGAFAGLNHDRTIRRINEAMEGSDVDVYNRWVDEATGTQRGGFYPSSYKVLWDGDEQMKTSEGTRGTGGGEIIVRAKSSGGIPAVFFSIAKVLYSSTTAFQDGD